MGRQHFSLEVSMLLFQARLQQQKQEGDFGEDFCNRCIELLNKMPTHPQLGEAYWLKANAAILQGNYQRHVEHKHLADEVFAKRTSWLGKCCNGMK
jgi:hypothetical protein